MTTAADLVAETKQYFLGGIREQKNKLASGGTTASLADTALTFTYDLGPIQAGAVLTVGLERMYVWTVSGTTATVQRAWDGTTLATHTVGDIVSVNSRCDDFSIFRALNNELASLSSPNKGLYRVRSIDLTYNASTYGFDLASSGTVIGQPLAVLAEGTGTGEWDQIPPSQWIYSASADSDDFASGRSLTLAYGSPGLAVRVVYRAPFVALTALTTDVNTTAFLPATANDILPMGAALQLATGRPMARSDGNAQGSTRRAEETSTQDTLIAVSGLKSRYEDRIRDEALRLLGDHGQAI